MQKRNIFSAVAMLAFSLAVGVKAATFPLGDLRRIGPGFFPLVLASLLGILSLALLLSFLGKREEGVPPRWPRQWLGIISVLVALFAYGFFLKFLGFSLANFLFSLALLKYGYPGKWMIPLGGALATTLFSFLVFKYWLGTPFPGGWIGF
jgi:hypothetical protein